MSKLDLESLTKTMTETLEKVVDGVKEVVATHAEVDINEDQKSLLDQIDELASLHADATKKLASLKKSLIKEVSKEEAGTDKNDKPSTKKEGDDKDQ